jgi:hypothetical protein
VLLGGPQGLSAVPVLQHLDRSGRHDHVQSLAVGDLDCDGLADLGSLRYAGFQSWVSVFSAADFPNGSIAFDVVPGYAADTRIVPVGDLDGDGCDDLVVGVPGVDTLWIVRGAPGGPL